MEASRNATASKKRYKSTTFLRIILLAIFGNLLNPLSTNALEFIKHLNSDNKKALEFVKRNYYVIENTPRCKSGETMGYVRPGDDLYVICTKSIIRSSNSYPEAIIDINETVTHENVHALQFCTPNDILGYKIPNYTVDEVSSMDGYKGIDKDNLQREYEAFLLEDYPDIVREESEAITNKYCY